MKQIHKNTHLLCVQVTRPVFSAQEKSPRVLPPRDGLGQEWVRKLCSFSSQQDTFDQKQRCRVGVSGRDRVFVLEQPCRSPSPALLSAPASAKLNSGFTLKPLRAPKSQNTHQVIQIEGMASESLPGRKRQQTVTSFKKNFIFKRTLHNEGDWHWNLPGPQFFYHDRTWQQLFLCLFNTKPL